MLFNSLPFLFLYLPLALLGYHIAGRFGARAVIGWLGFMSVVFYAVWRYEFVILLVGSVLVNFAFSRLIVQARGKTRRQKLVMAAGVSANLLLLFYYKYLFPSLAGLHRLGILHHQFAGTLLPLGISFFTFTQIAYLIDLQEGSAEPQGFPEYLLFVTFFPHLIAGPILHHSEIMPQFKRPRFELNAQDLSIGLS
jgi:alginate O-acetyltransferase complex protein AlgI